jgi:hypothetical protein
MREVSTTWRYNPDKLIARADKKWAAMNARAESDIQHPENFSQEN